MQSFFRATDYRGELVPAMQIEEFVPFVPDEPHWSLAGAEAPDHPALSAATVGGGDGDGGSPRG